ncbi:MAG: hypothetical protein NZ937_08625, partial [Armatimonadetes bacterium]|nr:hypothetical protein [Armatimonadota bacterium]
TERRQVTCKSHEFNAPYGAPCKGSKKEQEVCQSSVRLAKQNFGSASTEREVIVIWLSEKSN